MVRQQTWIKAIITFTGSGILILVISALASNYLQYKGNEKIAETNVRLGTVEMAIKSMSDSIKYLSGEIGYIKRKQRLQDYDTRITRHNLNDILRQNGLKPMDIEPFEPPTMDDLVEDYREKHNGKNPY